VRITALIDDLMSLACADSRVEDIDREIVAMAELVREAKSVADSPGQRHQIRKAWWRTGRIEIGFVVRRPLDRPRFRPTTAVNFPGSRLIEFQRRLAF